MIVAPPRATPTSPGSGARLTRAAIGLLLTAGLAACGPATGDFGRPRPNVIHDTVMPTVGDVIARQRGEPVSSYRRTDDEQEMRDLAWGIVMPPLERERCERLLVELRRTRILPTGRNRLDKAAYVEALIATPYRSSVARYAKLKDDVVTDTQRIEPFFQTAAKVADSDRARGKAVDRLPDVRPDERVNALARIEENGLLIAWVRDSFEERLATYRYTLDRLILETPDRSSIEVQAAIDAFASVLRSLKPLGAPRGVFKG